MRNWPFGSSFPLRSIRKLVNRENTTRSLSSDNSITYIWFLGSSILFISHLLSASICFTILILRSLGLRSSSGIFSSANWRAPSIDERILRTGFHMKVPLTSAKSEFFTGSELSDLWFVLTILLWLDLFLSYLGVTDRCISFWCPLFGRTTSPCPLFRSPKANWENSEIDTEFCIHRDFCILRIRGICVVTLSDIEEPRSIDARISSKAVISRYIGVANSWLIVTKLQKSG